MELRPGDIDRLTPSPLVRRFGSKIIAAASLAEQNLSAELTARFNRHPVSQLKQFPFEQVPSSRLNRRS
jgi:hypothetical protein